MLWMKSWEKETYQEIAPSEKLKKEIDEKLLLEKKCDKIEK